MAPAPWHQAPWHPGTLHRYRARSTVTIVPRIGPSHHGETRIRLLRVVRRGDRHDPRDLSVACRFEGDLSSAFVDGRLDALIPGEAVKNLVYATARDAGAKEIENLGLAIAQRILEDHPQVTRTRVEIAENAWHRLDVGGKAQGQAFIAGSGEKRTATITSNGQQVAVVSGIENLTIMRTAGFAPSRKATEDPGGRDDLLQRMLMASVSAKWTYSSGDVTFGPYRQGVRAAVVETFGCHGRRTVPHTMYAIADIVLGSFEEIAEITISVQERPYRPADLFKAGLENPDDLFVVLDEPLGLVEVTVERD
jgi:urate oxidase